MSTIPTNRESDRFMLRLPDGMRDRIKAAAARNDRSMNAEIVHALTYWLEIDLPSDVELGPGTDAAEVGRKDWDESTKDTENYYKKELERSIHVMQQIMRSMKLVRHEGLAEMRAKREHARIEAKKRTDAD